MLFSVYDKISCYGNASNASFAEAMSHSENNHQYLIQLTAHFPTMSSKCEKNDQGNNPVVH